MTTAARRWLAAAAVAASALTLSACDGAGDDPTTPPETTSTEPSTEPSEDITTDGPTAEPPEVEKPTAPPEMAVDDIDGAAAAAWYFLKLYDYMRATGDTAGWDAISSAACEWCINVMTETESVFSDGGRIESAGLEFDITTAGVRLPEGETDFYTVVLTVIEPPTSLIASDGTATETGGHTLDPMGIGVRYVGGHFEVVAVSYEIA